MLLLKKAVGWILLFATGALISQSNEAERLYQEGVKQSNVKKYEAADSLFTLSANLEPHPDTYFNRAAIRSRLNNKKGYCEDLACAAAMNDVESLDLFCKECGKADTSFNNNGLLQSWQAAYTVTYTSIHFVNNLIGRYNAKKRLINIDWNEPWHYRNYTHQDSTNRVDEVAEFSGGFVALARFIQANLSYPIEAREAGISGTVNLEFVINSFGYVKNIKVIKGIVGCKSCDYEAARIVAIMPRWKPAKIDGKNVSVSFGLPVNYKIVGGGRID